MSRRIVVASACEKRCPSCIACPPSLGFTSIEVVREARGEEDGVLLLGGGDATRWPHLDAFLDENRAREAPQKIWIEAPAKSFTPEVLASLRAHGASGICVIIEAAGAQMAKALGVGDGEQVIREAEALGLETEARALVRPRTFAMLVPLARRLHPRTVWLEIVRQDWGGKPVPMPAAAVDEALAQSPNVRFSSHRLLDVAYLPPCVLPASWRARPRIWQATHSDRVEPNAVLPICHECVWSRRCNWNDPGALSDETRASATPIRKMPPGRRILETPVPEAIVNKRPAADVICTEPWHTIEMAGHDGLLRQCGGNWTEGVRGSIYDNTLVEIWNGAGFQEARRIMASGKTSGLCKPICTRLYDGVLHERKLKIQAGAEVFVKNQLLLAEDMAERREVMRAMPLHMTLCPSTYCNYNCLFCDHGRRPRWDMPERVWDELPIFLPTLRTLTLLGGEPLANPRVWDFLTDLDTDRYPDVRIDIFTNGALMTEKALRRIKSEALGEITISLNAGTDETYQQVERGGTSLAKVIENVDALIRFREAYPWWFGITLSLIVMRENAHTLIPFGQLAHERNLHLRLVGLNVQDYESLDFYKHPDEVARVVGHLREFIAWAERVRPEYMPQAQAAVDAITGESEARQRDALISLRRSAGGARLA